MSKLLRRRNDDCLYLGGESAVGVGNRSLGLEIDHVSDTPDYMTDAKFTTYVNGKVIIMNDSHTFHSGSSLTDDIDLLVIRKETPFSYIDSHGNHDLIKHRKGSLQNVQMTCGEWIE
jgi:hypothetical protein